MAPLTKRPALAGDGEALRRIFGTNLHAARLRRRFTQAELGAMSGANQAYISQIERGLTNVTLASISALSIAVGVSVIDLLRADLVTASRGEIDAYEQEMADRRAARRKKRLKL